MGNLLAELNARLPPDCIQSDPEAVAAYSQDRAIFEPAGTAAVLVMPRSTDEVVATVLAANAADAPIVPRGAGSGLTGAANASDGCIILSLHRMNQILEIDTTNRLARVQPGLINLDLKAAAKKVGLFYPPDPASVDISSIGGNVATNAGGLCCVKYGVTRDYVVGLEVVLADGDVIRTGRHTIKNTTGLDLTGLFVGSEGTLGVITEVTLKLVPQRPPAATAVAYFEEFYRAGEAIVEIFQQGHEPSLMEIIDQPSLRQVEEVYHMDLDIDAAVLLLMQTEGDEAAETIATLAAICKANGATFVHYATDQVEADMLIEVRRRVWAAFETLGKAMLPEDVAVPRQRLPELMAGIVAIGERHNVSLPTIGHAGDGNMHPLLIFDGTDDAEVARVKDAFAEIMHLAVELEGTISAEHGVGTLKRRFLEDQLDPSQLRVQRAVRDLLDPTGRFNPGKAL